MGLVFKLIDLYLNHKRLSIHKRQQHANRVRIIINLIRPKSVSDIRLNSFFVEKFQSNSWKATTVVHYILSIQKLLEYMHSRNNSIAITENQKQKLTSLIKDLPDWRDEYKDYIKKQKNDLWKKRKLTLHDPTDVTKYKNSEEFTSFKKLMQKIKTSTGKITIIKSQYDSVLRGIVTNFQLRCAIRAGIFGNIT